MDQDAYHKTYREINERFCLFEKSILAGKCRCPHSHKFYLAEREGIHCESDPGQAQCQEFIRLLRHHARFTLKANDETISLPHGQAMKLQIGGMRGVCALLDNQGQAPDVVENVEGALSQARQRFNTLEQLPFQAIIQQVAAYKGRSRRKRT